MRLFGLCVDEFLADDFGDAGADIIHLGDPSHLVASFEGFGDTLPVGQFFDQAVEHFLDR